ncbi:MAG: ABC transporter permease [Planctomycetota bacterium]
MRAIRRKRGDVSLICGASVLVALLILAALAPLLAPHDPREMHLDRRLEGFSWSFPLGTDHLGRCVLARLLHGARISLGLTAAVVLGQGILGTLLGAAAAYRGGFLDLGFVALADLLLALPGTVLALVAVGLLGPSLEGLVLLLSLIGWTSFGRVARGAVLQEREQLYVQAAIALGSSPVRILRRLLLPAVLRSILVLSSMRAGHVLLTISGLGFLGLGVAPPTAEWGTMMAEGRIFVRNAPWVTVFPGLAMIVAILGSGLLAEGLRLRMGGPRLQGT